MAQYNYPTVDVNLGLFDEEVLASGLAGVYTGASLTDVELQVFFDVVLDGAQETELDALVAAHDSGGSSVDDLAMSVAVMRWRGQWLAGLEYIVGDMVEFDGSSWFAVAGSVGSQPGLGAEWEVLAAEGVQGAQGPQGPQGDVGPQGIQGIAGPEGPQGPQGVKGDTGDVGPAGPQGPQGLQGDQGIQGPAGDQGPQGDVGPQGPQGPAGVDGLNITWRGAYSGVTAYVVNDAVVYNGSSYICTANSTGNLPTDPGFWDLMAAEGEQGPVGPEGPQGEVGPQGPQGVQGVAGPEGPQGPQGEPGVNTWGSIGGTLSDQADLQGALEARLPLAGGTLTGNLTVADGKTITVDSAEMGDRPSVSTQAQWAHKDHFDSVTGYALLQTAASGATILNAEAGATVTIAVAAAAQAVFNAGSMSLPQAGAGIYFGGDVSMVRGGADYLLMGATDQIRVQVDPNHANALTRRSYVDTGLAGKSNVGHGHLASEVTDFHAQVRTNRLDQMAAPTADVAFNNAAKLTQLVAGTASGHAVNKGQMDAALADVDSIHRNVQTVVQTNAISATGGRVVKCSHLVDQPGGPNTATLPPAVPGMRFEIYNIGPQKSVYIAADGTDGLWWYNKLVSQFSLPLGGSAVVQCVDGEGGGDPYWLVDAKPTETFGVFSRTSNRTIGSGSFNSCAVQAIDAGGAGWDITGGVIYPPVSGWYNVTITYGWDGNSNGQRLIGFKINAVTGVDVITDQGPANVQNAIHVHTGSCVQYLNAGDYLCPIAYQNSGGNLDIRGTGAQSMRASLFLLQGG